MSLRIAIFIDGSNFYSKLKSLQISATSTFAFAQFLQYLTNNITPVYIGYYVGQIRTEPMNFKSIVLYRQQQQLFIHLQKTIPGISIVRGHIQNFNGIYREKGVDVRLALDLYRLCRDNCYDKALLLSSDTDLLPAISMVQQCGKIVEYIGFSHNPSIALSKKCVFKHLLSYKNIFPFIRGKL